MPGADAPAAARGVVDSTRVSHHGHTGVARHSPRNGFNGFLRALPGDRACLPPSPPRSLLLKNLMPASGHQDHATSPSAASIARQARRPRPPHPAPTFVTLRNAPPSGAGPNRYIADLGSGSRKNSENQKSIAGRWQFGTQAPGHHRTIMRTLLSIQARSKTARRPRVNGVAGACNPLLQVRM
jgi:hypothetical protein